MESKKKGIRIAITGPECTGKTTLAKQLAAHYKGLWVPEFARLHLTNLEGKYNYQDLLFMARQQIELEDNIWNKAGKNPVFSDTDMLVYYIWSTFRFDKCDAFIIDRIHKKNYHHYLLMYPDLPWENDSLRENSDNLDALFILYEKALQQFQIPYSVISGKGNIRLGNAMSAIKYWL